MLCRKQKSVAAARNLDSSVVLLVTYSLNRLSFFVVLIFATIKFRLSFPVSSLCKQKKTVVSVSKANYTDRATAACRRS
jgi:hypothetical protein